MAKTPKFKTVDDYFNSMLPDTKKALLELRAIIQKTVPDAEELINYDIPAYALVEGGKRDKQIMIAGYKAFVSLYTGTGILEAFSKELAGYTVGKASVQFPISEPLPEALIVKLIKSKVKSINQ